MAVGALGLIILLARLLLAEELRRKSELAQILLLPVAVRLVPEHQRKQYPVLPQIALFPAIITVLPAVP